MVAFIHADSLTGGVVISQTQTGWRSIFFLCVSIFEKEKNWLDLGMCLLTAIAVSSFVGHQLGV